MAISLQQYKTEVFVTQIVWNINITYFRSEKKTNIYEVPSISFQTFLYQAFKIVIDSWKFSILLLYILWDDWPIFRISALNEQLQQQLEYTLLKPDCHNWWISKVQSGREDTLEEWYAIKFCFKLGKNATEMYGMLQTAFWASCMNQASIFEWHKRFKEGRESVRDDKRCGRSKEVRTPELTGQIKYFMDKDRCVSIETISAQFDVSVGTVHTIIRDELKMRKICTKFVPRVLREDQKERRCHDSREIVELINSDPEVLDALVTCDESWIYCYDPETKRQSSQWKHAGSPRPKKPKQSKSTHKLWWSLFFDSTGMIYMYWVLTGQRVNKEYYVEVLREFRKRFRQKRPALFKSGQWHFYQSTTPSLSQTIWPRWASTQFLTLPIVQTLLPVTFGYSLSSRKNLETVIMRQLRRWKRLWRRSLTCSHKRTSKGPSRSCWNSTSALQLEEITLKGTRVSCVYYQ